MTPHPKAVSRAVCIAGLMVASLAVLPVAQARVPGRAPTILSARCTPAAACEANPARVHPRGELLLTGHLGAGMIVLFRAQATRPGRPVQARALIHRLGAGLIVHVPSRAVSGHIYALDRYGRRSRAYGPIYVVRHRATGGSGGASAGGAPSGTAFDGTGMWIWYLSKSDGGNLDTIAARAHRAGVGTVFLKSSDGSTNYWAQFSAANVAALKARGLRVCAWQYVYGTRPAGEAALGAEAVTNGADCLVIDAEAEYEGRYSAAQTYVQDLRSRVGPSFPVGLASFPYVDYHPSLPYSVFLGPGAAQFDVPQMYWKDIGTTVDNVYAHTYTHNRIYGRPIAPLGQTYSSPPPAEIERFRALAQAYRAGGTSYWDWQETNASGWAALGAAVTAPPGFVPSSAYPVLASGSKGDEVLWLQEHLASVAPSTPTSGTFDYTTMRNLETFQSNRSLPATGRTDAQTWADLLALSPIFVSWNGSSGQADAASAHGVRRQPHGPESASVRSLRYEIPRVG